MSTPSKATVRAAIRLLGEAVAWAEVESVLAPGLNTVKTFRPAPQVLEGSELTGIRRRGKVFLLDSDSGHSVLIHLMSAGRLQLFDERAKLTDRRSRLLIRLADGRELRLREFGTHQRAWARVVETDHVLEDESISGLGPEAWPEPPGLVGLLDEPRPLYSVLRDQRVIAGIGRSWVDEILWSARLSPFKRGSDLEAAEAGKLRKAITGRLGGAIDFYMGELSTTTRGSPARAVARRSRRSITAITSCVTAPQSRPAASRSRTAASPAS